MSNIVTMYVVIRFIEKIIEAKELREIGQSVVRHASVEVIFPI